MFNQLKEAIKKKDYQTAEHLLIQLKKQQPDDLWMLLYQAQIYEGTNRLEPAENIYRQLLQNTSNPQIILNARKGIERIQILEAENFKQALGEYLAIPGSDDQGILILQPVSLEVRKILATPFAKIMKLDPYSANLRLPTKNLRIYRTGTMGELNFYRDQLNFAAIPSFSLSLTEINQVNVYQVNYFQSIAPTATISCQNQQGQQGNLTFSWSEVRSRVQGLIPLWEKSPDKFLQHKQPNTLDYAQIYDLHLPERKIIIRLCDYLYQFSQGISFAPKPDNLQAIAQTSRENWTKLTHFLNQRLSQLSLASDFPNFAPNALDFTLFLQKVKPRLKLFRQEDNPRIQAFQLYSCLVFSQEQKINQG